MLQFQFVDVNRHIGPDEILQPTAVVKVQVTNNDGFDVLDAMSCFGDGLVEIMLARVIIDLGENVVDGCLGIGVSSSMIIAALMGWKKGGGRRWSSVRQQPLLKWLWSVNYKIPYDEIVRGVLLASHLGNCFPSPSPTGPSPPWGALSTPRCTPVSAEVAARLDYSWLRRGRYPGVQNLSDDPTA